MLRLTIVLLGFAVFGALFAVAYYQPSDVHREISSPRFLLEPGERVPVLLDTVPPGSTVTANVTVSQGGPVAVYVMDLENLSRALDGERTGTLLDKNVSYRDELSQANIATSHQLEFTIQDRTRLALLLVSQVARDPDIPIEDQLTGVSARVRYQGEDLDLPSPKFRLAPGERRPDYIEPAARGEEVQVNITVLSGGPVEVYLMDMENLTKALDGTRYGFELGEDVIYDTRYSRTNITENYRFTFTADGENRTALLIGSQMDPDDARPGEAQTTEVAITMRYSQTETRSLILGYLLAAPSVLLVAHVFYRHLKRRRAGDMP